MAHAVGQSEAPAASRKSAWWIAAAWILPTVLLSPGLFANRVLFWHDVTRTMLPFRQLAAKAISEGRLPVWTHLSGAGAAPYGEGQAGVFYPPNSLSYVARIPPWTDYTLQLWLHLGIAATVTFLWLHRSHGLSAPAAYLGSQIFALSGFLVSHFMHLHIVQIAAWLPALLWLSEALARWEKPLPSFVVAAALVAALALAGFPQICYMIVLAALIWAAASAKSRAAAVRALGALCAASALGLLIAAVQLLPTAAHLAATGARAKPTIEFMRRYSLDWRGLLFFLQPEVFGSYHQGDYFGAIHHYEVCGWVGGVPLLLAPVALLAGTPGRRRLVIASALLVTGGLFLGLAQYNPVYHLLVHVPIISKFRAAGRYVLWIDMGLAVLAAVGLEALCLRQERARKIARWTAAGVLVAWLSASACVTGGRSLLRHVMYEEALRRSHGDHATAAAKTEEKFSYVVNQLSPANGYVLLWLGASAFLLTMSFGSNGHVLRASACGLAAVELGHLLLFALPYNPWAPTRFFLEPSDVARLIQREPVPGQRVFTDPAAVDAGGVRAKWGRLGALSEGDLKLIFEQRELLVPDTNVVFGVEELGCRFTFSPRRLWYWTEKRLEQMLGGSEDEVARAVGVLRKFGVRWLITTEERATRIPGRIIARWPMTGAALVRLQEPRTSQNGIYRCLAYVPRKVIVASDAERANEYMELYSLDPDVAVIECPANGSARAGAGVVRHASYSGDQAQVWVDMAKAGLVVLGVQFDPGWNITIDGKREHLAVVRANSILTGLEAPPGRHCIALRYHPPGLTAGGAASALGIAVWIVLLVCARARKG